MCMGESVVKEELETREEMERGKWIIKEEKEEWLSN